MREGALSILTNLLRIPVIIGLFFILFAIPAVASAALAVDITANGLNGPIDVDGTSTFTYEWTSTDATTCNLTSPSGNSGISTSGSGGPIDSSHPWYPSSGSSTTLTLECTDGTDTLSDSVVINLVLPTPTVDIKANGSDGTVTISSGDTWSYSWDSTNTTTCTLDSPSGVSGISTSGSGGPIDSSHPWYPSSGSSTTLTFECTNGVDTVSDNVVIEISSGGSGGGGGGGSGGGGGGGGGALTTDIDINSSDGPVEITDGDTWDYSWDSTNASTCTLTSPTGVSGVSLSGSGGPIDSSHPWYPTSATSTTLTLECVGGASATSTDSVTVSIATPPPPGGGGGGSGGGGGGGGGSSSGGRGSSGGGSSTISIDTSTTCLYMDKYLRIDFNNDPVEVIKLQAFLINFEGHSELALNGVFDQATFNAVSDFQTKYAQDVLEPWGLTDPTGYVYITTLKKINEIYCQKIFPLDQAQVNEIAAYRALLQSIAEQEAAIEAREATTTPEIPPIVGQGPPQGQNLRNIAAAFLVGPTNLTDTFECVYKFIFIFIIIYVLSSALRDVLYKEKKETVLKRFLTKWISTILSIILAMVLAYIVGTWCLLLPLLIALILSIIWMLLYPKHENINTKARALQERAKSIRQKKSEGSPDSQ